MGGEAPKRPWARAVEEAISRLSKMLKVEAAIVFGSWARSGGGEWSDVDLLIVSPDSKDVSVIDRFKLAAEASPPRVDVFIYTAEELRRMVERGNPLALSALVEGIVLRSTPSVEELIAYAKKSYVKAGRVWIKSPNRPCPH
ncbi:MAG: nucleotidyltransferase domain-containing protein [Candidatus Nezhaarchaeota archaeon]|nr:nucleotidyltransferase domain-containing protein [Candidatus Nezhaarchaeota archaeon]